MRLIFSTLVILLVVTDISGQNDTIKHKIDSLPDRFYILQKVERGGVAMPEIEIKEVTVYGKSRGERKRDYRRYERLIYHIKIVYPYALLVKDKLGKVNEDLKNITDEKEQRKYLRDVEKDVFGEYEDDIRNMTITQGRILLKLIDRETQNTSFALIRDYRGKFPAVFWQSIARIFGTDLKAEYDPYGEDALIEFIITEIEAGRL